MLAPARILGTDSGEIDYDDGFDRVEDDTTKGNNKESNIEPINE